jgi:hypothetical protein
MHKVHILSTCSHCEDEAFQSVGEAEDCQGHKYIRYTPCPICEGSGNEPKWVDLDDFDYHGISIIVNKKKGQRTYQSPLWRGCDLTETEIVALALFEEAKT